MALDIRHDRSAHRFEALVEGVLCELDYTLSDGSSPDAARVMAIDHTGVPAAVSGRGIAGELVRAALTVARTEGWSVVPACSYAASWMARHPEFDDLRL